MDARIKSGHDAFWALYPLLDAVIAGLDPAIHSTGASIR